MAPDSEPISKKSSKLPDYQQIGELLQLLQQAGAVIPPDLSAPPEAVRRTPRPDGLVEAPTDSLRSVRQRRGEFARAISMAFTIEEIIPEVTSDAKAAKRFRNLEQIKKASDSLRKYLSDADAIITTALTGRGAEIHSLSRALDAVARASEEEIAFQIAEGTSDKAGLKFNSRTPKGWLLKKLVDTYTGFLGLPAHIVYNDNIPEGPFITFLIEAHRLMGKAAPAPSAIQKNLERAGLSNKFQRGSE